MAFETPPPLTAAGKGRWIAMATVVAVTAAWTIMSSYGQIRSFDGEGHDEFPPAVFILTGFYIGLPVALIVGTIIGRLAERWLADRWRVHVASIAATLLVDLPPTAVVSDEHLLSSSALAMIVVSLAMAVPASLMLERWTRRDDALPAARVA
jgi:hypothetical protein